MKISFDKFYDCTRCESLSCSGRGIALGVLCPYTVAFGQKSEPGKQARVPSQGN